MVNKNENIDLLLELFFPANSLSMTDSSKTTWRLGRKTTWIDSSFFCGSSNTIGGPSVEHVRER